MRNLQEDEDEMLVCAWYLHIRSNKVTVRFADHNKTKVHLEAVDREASRLSAESGVRIFFTLIFHER